MVDPVQTLDLFLSVSNRIGIWTHFYDHDVVRSKWPKKFAATPKCVDYKGMNLETYRQDYQEALGWGGFCGGSAPHSYWLTKSAITSMLNASGFEFEIISEDLQHQNGPCMLLYAENRVQ